MSYHIYRPKNSDITYGFRINSRGATLYQAGDCYGVFFQGNFTANDLDLILELDRELTEEIDRAFEKLELEGEDF